MTNTQNKKALIVTWEGYQDQEVLYPYYRLQEDKFEVMVLAEKVGTFYGILGTKMEATLNVSDIGAQYDEVDLIVLPGGVKALEKLRQQKNVVDFITRCANTGKVITSTCHGAQLLISAKVVKGKEISGYYSIKDDIENAGAIYVDAPAVVSHNIITSPHYKHMGEWMKVSIDTFYKFYGWKYLA